MTQHRHQQDAEADQVGQPSLGHLGAVVEDLAGPAVGDGVGVHQLLRLAEDRAEGLFFNIEAEAGFIAAVEDEVGLEAGLFKVVGHTQKQVACRHQQVDLPCLQRVEGGVAGVVGGRIAMPGNHSWNTSA